MDKQFEEEVILKAGQSTAFEIPFKGNPQPKVTWTYNGEALPQEKRIESETIYNMTTLRLGKVKRSDTGNYTLTLDNSAGKVSITIKLTVMGMYLCCNRGFIRSMLRIKIKQKSHLSFVNLGLLSDHRQTQCPTRTDTI